MPLGFREDDSLHGFIARPTLGLYNHFLAATESHSEVARILGVHRNTLDLCVERARRILRASQPALASRTFRVDTVRSQVYIRPANVSPRLLALSGLIFPSLPADKLFPATHQELTYPIA